MEFVIRDGNGRLVYTMLTGKPMTFTSKADADEARADLDFEDRRNRPHRVEPKPAEDELATVEIDTGDSVFHVPTGENWLVAYVDGERLAWCGWPEGTAALADCRLVRKATPEERERLLRQIASGSGDGARQRHARNKLELTLTTSDG